MKKSKKLFFILISLIIIFQTKNIFATQVDTIFVGEKICYVIEGQDKASEIILKASGATIEQKSNNEIILSYQEKGEYSIMICERNSANCLGEFSTIEIFVKENPNLPKPEEPNEEPENPNEEPENPENNNDKIEINFPNIFTPNNDGINDYYHIIYNNRPENFSIIIFNRIGNKVFTSSNPDFKWNGENCSPGSYFYQASYKENNQTKNLNGTINLVKEK